MTATTHPETWPNPWTEAPEDEPLAGHDVPEDYNGLQISMAKYLNYIREQQAQTTEEQVAA